VPITGFDMKDFLDNIGDNMDDDGLPKYLFRYRNKESHIEDILNGHIYFSQLFKFREMDPRDSYPHVKCQMKEYKRNKMLRKLMKGRYSIERLNKVTKSEIYTSFINNFKNMERFFINTNEYMQDKISACCFSGSFDDERIWKKDKYTNGVCFVFERKDLLLSPWRQLNFSIWPMDYSKKKPKVYIYYNNIEFPEKDSLINIGYDKFIEENNGNELQVKANKGYFINLAPDKIKEMFSVKSKEYEYQNEWRILLFPKDFRKIGGIEYNKDALCGIIFGYEMPKNKKDRIISWLPDKNIYIYEIDENMNIRKLL